MGPVADVTAKYATRAHRVETEDVALALLTFRSGALGAIVTTTAAFPGAPQRLEITGTEGTVVIEDGKIARRALAAEHPQQPAETIATGSDSAHLAQIADLLEAVDQGREPSVTGEDGRAALELVCAVYESAREGRTVTLPAQ
jgi:predicted dehydrogenase